MVFFAVFQPIQRFQPARVRARCWCVKSGVFAISRWWRRVFLFSTTGRSPAIGSGRSTPSRHAAQQSRAATMGESVKHTVLTWNIAAINNNPFEYWIHHTDPKYNELMMAIAEFVHNPGSKDVPVSQIFPQAMFDRLRERMEKMQWVGVAETAEAYANDFSQRRIISGFLKDSTLGKKRLASWPDRLTNTIMSNQASGSGANARGFLCRPTVINCFEGDLSSLDTWFSAWETFMFDTPINDKGQKPCDILSPVRRAKYPQVTEEEERISLPLQTLCLAIFDAIQVHMMNESGVADWMGIKRGIMEKMNLGKVARTIEICQRYADSDVMCLQECGRGFLDAVRKSQLASTHYVVSSASADPNRDQNSLILLKKKVFGGDIHEHSEAAFAAFPKDQKIPVSAGDLLLVSAPLLTDDGRTALIASFHGDTNGLASIPVVTAVHAAAQSVEHSTFIFGLDANVYETPKPGLAPFDDFIDATKRLEFETTWAEKLSAKNYTTFNARTYVQPQLNKASTPDAMKQKGDMNPKDFILVNEGRFRNFVTFKDNTGKGEYLEGIPFPSLEFPSDHGLVVSTMELVSIAK